MDKSWKDLFTAVLSNAISVSYEVKDMDVVGGKKVDKEGQDKMVSIYKDIREKIRNDQPLTYADISMLSIATNIVRIRLKTELAKMTASVNLMEDKVASWLSDRKFFSDTDAVPAKFIEKTSVPMD